MDLILTTPALHYRVWVLIHLLVSSHFLPQTQQFSLLLSENARPNHSLLLLLTLSIYLEYQKTFVISCN
jgi:hypothetical protein